MLRLKVEGVEADFFLSLDLWTVFPGFWGLVLGIHAMFAFPSVLNIKMLIMNYKTTTFSAHVLVTFDL